MAEGSQDDGQEKSLDPTPQRIQKAREEGDIPRSADLNTFVSYVGLFLALIIAGASMSQDVGAVLSSFLASPHLMAGKILGPGGMSVLWHYIGAALIALTPLFLLPALGALVSLLGQRAIVVAPTKIEPKISRIDPIANAKQKFGLNGLVEFFKSIVKLFTIGFIIALILSYEMDDKIALLLYDARVLPEIILKEAMTVIIASMGVVGIIAVFDYLWQIQSHRQRLMMSQQDMKDEMKNTEGDPTFKQTRRERARAIAMNRSIDDVPSADVVIVNPIHIAIALKWDRKPGSAPICVAKGKDALAARIRDVATEAGVPIHRDQPTARLLFDAVEIGEEIAPEHYQAVAVAIRFADETRRRARDTYRPSR